MKMYVGHSRESDYQQELYEPLRHSRLSERHTFIFPHENTSAQPSQTTIEACDAMIAEVSLPSTGLGIEIGFACMYEKPVLCLFRHDARISNSLRLIPVDLCAYKDSAELVEQVEVWLQRLDA